MSKPPLIPLDSELMARILHARKIGVSLRQISKIERVGYMSVFNALKRYEHEMFIEAEHDTSRELGLDQVEAVRKLIPNQMSDKTARAIAMDHHLTPEHVRILAKGRRWSRRARLLLVPEVSARPMTVSQLAEKSGLSRDTVNSRLRKGLRGLDLVAPARKRGLDARL